ncbi:MAG: nuclear transport factor 2 family protein [Burkholderiales bacterium]
MLRRPAWLDELFLAIDAKDADRFASFIAEDGAFVFGNAPAVQGRQEIREAVAGFFASIRGLSHQVLGVAEEGAEVWLRGVVTYERHDGSKLTVPFSNYFEMQDGRVRHYQIYVDASALYAA